MKKKILSFILLCGLMAGMFISPALGAGYGTAIVDGGNADRVHLRERASAASKSLGLYFTGTEAVCASDPGKEWVKVIIGSETGYMNSEFLYRGANPGSVKPKQPKAVVSNIKASSWVNLRKEPSQRSAVAGTLRYKDEVAVLGQTAAKWYYVKAGDLYGYIMPDYLLLGGSTPGNPGNAYGTAIVDGKSADRVHLRERASASANSLGLYFTGTKVQCESDPNKEWVKVTIGSQTGYMKSEFLYSGSKPDSVKPKQPKAVVYNKKSTGWINLRKEPSQSAAAISKLYDGDSAIVLGQTASQWYYIKTGNQYGYIMADFLSVGGAVPSKPTGAPNKAAISAYKAVMQNKAAFYSTDDHKAVYLNQLANAFMDAPMKITQFALADLDGDGKPEVILWENVNGQDNGVEILHYQDGEVYGYNLAYRAFMALKRDGTFSYSSSAANGGFGLLTFTRNDCAIDPLTYSQSNDDANSNFSISYFVNRLPATEAAFHSALDKQDKKQDAVWYGFTNSNVESVLSRYE